MIEAMSKRTFESAMRRLEEIVSELEKGDLSLEQSLSMYEEGVELTKFCSSKLDESEKKIQVLTRDEEGFKLNSSEM
jgi:exodeoxyribonuclease VII small subunit